jgi:hypothetical protein
VDDDSTSTSALPAWLVVTMLVGASLLVVGACALFLRAGI